MCVCQRSGWGGGLLPAQGDVTAKQIMNDNSTLGLVITMSNICSHKKNWLSMGSWWYCE